MKKIFIAALFIIGVLFLFKQDVFAGGCCYKSFSSVNGIAGRQDAEINVAFVDPTSYGPNSGPYPLANKRIAIHLKAPRAGQSCWMISEYTDSSGHTEARCRSNVPGTVSVYFTSPDMDAEANQSIGYASRDVYFEVNPDAPVPTAVPTYSYPNPTYTQPTTIGLSMTPTIDPETEQLKQRVVELENEVERQKEEVSFLRSLIEKLLDSIRKLFN